MTTDKNFPRILAGALFPFSLLDDPSVDEDPLEAGEFTAGTGMEDRGSLFKLVELAPAGDATAPVSLVVLLRPADPNDTTMGDIGALEEEDCWRCSDVGDLFESKPNKGVLGLGD